MRGVKQVRKKHAPRADLGVRHGPIFAPKESAAFRRGVLNALDVAATRKNPDDQWLTFVSFKPDIPQIKRIMSTLLRLGLIDTRKRADGEVIARINYDGQQALIHNTLTHTALNKSITVQAPLLRKLNSIAAELEIMRTTGKGVGEQPSVVALLQAIGAKEEPFKRWFRFVYASAYETAAGADDEEKINSDDLSIESLKDV
jgi:hypothetical protein